jgi:hypothetical protein
MSGWDGNTRQIREWIPSSSARPPQVVPHLVTEMTHHRRKGHGEGDEESPQEHDLEDRRHAG